MKRVSIDEITGYEILAKDIFSSSGLTLMVRGTTVKKEYVEKLRILGIDYIYIKEKYEFEGKLDEFTEMKIKNQCQKQVKDAIELYSSYGTDQLVSIANIAQNIINDVFNQSEIMYSISGIRDKNESVFAHSLNVCTLSVLLAIKMKITRSKIKDIAVGCLLHDIGLTYCNFMSEGNEINEEEDEYAEERKKHVIYAYSTLSNQKWLSPVSLDIILNHHERLDGSGYPFGLAGSKIKKPTKIVAVCDAFDNLIYGNSSKKLKVYEAIDYIVSQADKKFDINVVKAFIDTVAAYPNGSIVTTNRGDKAVVISQNKKCPTRPIIQLLEDREHNVYTTCVEENLVDDLTLFIVDTEL